MDLQLLNNINWVFFVSDYKLDPQLIRSCKLDVPKFCKDVLHGEGRIVECLKKNYDVCF